MELWPNFIVKKSQNIWTENKNMKLFIFEYQLHSNFLGKLE